MAVLFTFYNTRNIFNISLCSYNITIIIFKYNSNMVMIRIVEYPIKENNISSRRLKDVVIPTMAFNTVICLRPLFPSHATCKRTRGFFRTNRNFESR